MNRFEAIRARHQELLAVQPNPPDDFNDQISRFIEEIRAAGRVVYPPQERTQLREFIRYWATILYERDSSRGYQVLELDAYAGPPVRRYSGLLVLAAALAVVAFTAGFLFFASRINLPGFAIQPTDTPDASPNVTVVVVITHTAVPPSLTPTRISTPTPTPSPTAAFLGTDTPAVEVSTGLVAIAVPQNGDVVPPELDFAGSYSNLTEGWSIHVILQPLSGGGKFVPLKEYFNVPADARSGDWRIHANLGEQFNIAEPDTYIATIALANTAALREELVRAAATGTAALPKGVLELADRPITFRRKAYLHIREARIVFSKHLEDARTTEIYSARLDGSDVRQMTFTADFTELEPALSPDGKQIAFVGVRATAPNSQDRMQGIWVMDSNGQNRRALVEERNRVFEEPAWSPDGRYIAFSASNVTAGRAAQWNLYLYDLVEDDLTLLTDGDQGGRYPSWMPDSQRIVFYQNFGISQVHIDFPGKYEVLVNTRLDETQPSVSRDGKKIAFIGYFAPQDPHEVYLLDTASGKVSKLTNEAYFILPQWFPDDSALLVQAIRFQQTFDFYILRLPEARPVILNPMLSGGVTADIGLMDAYLELPER